jgi:hypothetical protein
MVHSQTIEQIGRYTFAAISGARYGTTESSLIMPSGQGHYVTVTLEASDTYTVRHLFVRAGKVTVKQEWEDVYCDQLSDVAYEASLWRM